MVGNARGPRGPTPRFPMSSSESPIHFVAQNTKLCSFAMSRTFPARTSRSLPSNPCP